MFPAIRRQRARIEHWTDFKPERCWFALDLVEASSSRFNPLDQLISPPDRGLLSALARKGLPADAFVSRRARNRYEEVRMQTILQTLRSVASLEEALRLDSSPLTPVLESAIEGLAKAKQEPLEVNRTRACAAQITALAAIIEKGPVSDPEKNKVTSEEIQALRRLVGLAYVDIHPAAEVYWSTYRAFPPIAPSGQPATPAGSTADVAGERAQIMALIGQSISRIAELESAVRPVEALLTRLPADEQGCYAAFQEVARQVQPITRTLDYPERMRVLQVGLERLGKVRQGLQPSWQTIAADEAKVIKHDNPWVAIVSALFANLDELMALHTNYLERIENRVVKILTSVQAIEELADLQRQVEPINSFDERYGPMMDQTLKRLDGIGAEAAAALASPKGYTQRLGLQDTLDRVNELRSDLSTRFLLDTKRLMPPLDGIARLLRDNLYAVTESEGAAFRDPYEIGNPIRLARMDLFKGRIDLAARIVSILRSRRRPTLVLHGPRRMGKTSFLLQLPRLLPRSYVPVFLDMQEGGGTESDGNFLYALAFAIYRQLRSELQITKPDRAEFATEPYTGLTLWLDDLMPLIGERTLFLTLDEFEIIGRAIGQGKLTEEILGALRHLMQHNEKISFMFAGVQTMEALGPKSASYFISAYPIEISYLAPEETEELIRRPDPTAGKMPDYDDEVVAEMMRLTRCHPYLIQAICSEIIAVANAGSLTRIDDATLAQVITPVLSATASQYFKNTWEDADVEGQRVLKTLVGGPQRLDEGSVPGGILEGLLKRHVIEKLADGTYDIEIPLVREWIGRQVG